MELGAAVIHLFSAKNNTTLMVFQGLHWIKWLFIEAVEGVPSSSMDCTNTARTCFKAPRS